MSPTGTNRTKKRKGEHKVHVKFKTMGYSQRGAWSKAYENRKKSKHIIQTWKTIEYRRIEGLCLPCSMTVLSTWVECQCYLPSRVKWDNSIPRMHGSFGTFTILFLKGQNTNTSIDRSFTNQNRGKGTNRKAHFPKQLTNRKAQFHKQLTNRNTE